MKYLVFFIIVFGSFVAHTQSKAPLKVTVTNSESKPYSNEKILFVGKKSNKTFSGVSNAAGQFTINLPADDVYDIKVSTIGDAMEYNTLEIPSLPEGASFQEMELQIMYEMGSVFEISNLHFETAKAKIHSGSYKSLDQLVEYLKRKKSLRIQIAGHTDNEGAPEMNLKLSQDRADAVKNYLVSKGISASRLQSKGFGEARPVSDNSTSSGRARNRRTEIHILN